MQLLAITRKPLQDCGSSAGSQGKSLNSKHHAYETKIINLALQITPLCHLSHLNFKKYLELSIFKMTFKHEIINPEFAP